MRLASNLPGIKGILHRSEVGQGGGDPMWAVLSPEECLGQRLPVFQHLENLSMLIGEKTHHL